LRDLTERYPVVFVDAVFCDDDVTRPWNLKKKHKQILYSQLSKYNIFYGRTKYIRA